MMDVWLRGKKYKTRKTKKKPRRTRVHVEVRDPDLALELIKVYQGKDHTFHIILEERKKNGTGSKAEDK